MSATFSIEKPSIVAVLPRPIDRSNGRYVVSDVHGGIPGSRKRKRSELAVGADGEGLSIYDTRSSKLIASYAVPPQSSFTCDPSSLRLRTGTSGVERRTYVSSKEESAKIILFRDLVQPDGTTESTSVNKTLDSDNSGPVVFLDTFPDPRSPSKDSVLLIRKDGQILCLDGLDLNTRWISPAGVLGRNTATPDIIKHKVEFVQLTNAHQVSKTLLKNRQDLLSLSEETTENGYSPPILVVITTPDDMTLLIDRTLHILSLPTIARHGTPSITQAVHPLLSVSLPRTHQNVPTQISPVYSLHTTLGLLYELCDFFLTVIDLKESRPKVSSRLYLENSKSFMVFSSSSVIAASVDSVTIYYPPFQSIQASTNISSNLQPDSTKRKLDGEIPHTASQSCRLVAYSPKQSTAYAILGNDLLAFKINSRQDTVGQGRKIGHLLHSLGCGVARPPKPQRQLDRIPLESFGPYTVGSDTTSDWKMDEMISEMDRYVIAQDVEAFERVMAHHLGIRRHEKELRKWQARQLRKKRKRHGTIRINGTHDSMDEDDVVKNKPIPSWRLPNHQPAYREVDPRWTDYALSRIFGWSETDKTRQRDGGVAASQDDLKIVFYPHNVVNWLVESGSLTPTTIQSALRQDSQVSIPRKVYPGQLVTALSEVDPEFEMLSSLLSHAFLDAEELLQAIRLLMQSLELFGETHSTELTILPHGEVPDLVDSELQARIEMEQEEADRALALAEHRLGDYSSIRGRALSLALAKLSACPPRAVVSALRSMLSSSEIVSLIYLLRFELGRGGWTFRYLNIGQEESGEEDVGQNNSITLVSGLLSCCVDAIGSGGWLTGDAMLVDGDVYQSEELITSLRLKVSAALEGIEEASYLQGLTAEMVRYGEALQGAAQSSPRKKRKGEDTRPITVPAVDQDLTILPFGLKADKQVSLHRIGLGGEIRWRTARDIGQLKSMKVGRYSRERIDI